MTETMQRQPDTTTRRRREVRPWQVPPEQRRSILTDLKSPDPQVRRAAIGSIVVRGTIALAVAAATGYFAHELLVDPGPAIPTEIPPGPITVPGLE